MSVNQISQDYLSWRRHHHHHHHHDSPNNSNSLLFQNFNLNHPNDDVPESQHPALIDSNSNYQQPQQQQQQQQQQMQVMFEKPLTPSDVGKLNRLVIPKQHAERHFPLNMLNGGADSSGMLLSFEDEDGKFWRFRYSYWNSSQSYVLTKGWSRYVKDKRLDAGDVVVFNRHGTDPDRLFIAWRRRHDPVQIDSTAAAASAVAGGRSGSSLYHRTAAYPEGSTAGVVNGGRTASFNGSTSSRTLRLFGVNMEYQFESDQSEPVTPDGSFTSSPNAHHQPIHQGAYQLYSHFYPQAYYTMVQQDGSHGQHRG